MGTWIEQMTLRELIVSALRRWPVLLLGAVLTLAALYLVVQQPGIYWTRFDVVVLAPVGREYRNNLEEPDYQLAPMAGLVARDWNGTDDPLLTSSTDVSLHGMGERDGVQVKIPNQGTQWRPLYFAPNIEVQVVASTPEEVAARADRVRGELDALLQARQDTLLVDPTSRMTSIASPAEPTITHVTGSRSRAGLATGLAGLALTIVAASWLDRRLTPRN